MRQLLCIIWFSSYGRSFPFTIGAYLLGVVALLNLKYCQSKIYRIAFFVFYCIIVVCTLVAIMGMTKWWELLMYAPHLIIIVAAILIVSKRNGNTRENL